MFGGLVGAGHTTVAKHAVGEYEAPANMGSPINQFGNDPTQATITHGSTTYPDMWANVFGPSSNKDKGDAIQAKLCPRQRPTTARCRNTDYDADGYFYGVEVPDGSNGTLNFQVFDPEFAHVGDNCGDERRQQRRTRPISQAAAALAPELQPAVRSEQPVGSLRHRGEQPVLHRRPVLQRRRQQSHAAVDDVHRPRSRTTRRPTRRTTRSCARSTSPATSATSRTR